MEAEGGGAPQGPRRSRGAGRRSRPVRPDRREGRPAGRLRGRRDPKEDLPHKPAMPPEAESGAAVVAVVVIIGLWGRRKMPQRVGP